MFLPFALMLMGALGLFLVSQKIKAGLLVGILTQLFLAFWALIEHSPGLLISAILYGLVLHYFDIWNFRRAPKQYPIELCAVKMPWPDYDGGTVYCEKPLHNDKHRAGPWIW